MKLVGSSLCLIFQESLAGNHLRGIETRVGNRNEKLKNRNSELVRQLSDGVLLESWFYLEQEARSQ